MDPRDHARLGAQGHLGNPKGTRAQKYLENRHVDPRQSGHQGTSKGGTTQAGGQGSRGRRRSGPEHEAGHQKAGGSPGTYESDLVIPGNITQGGNGATA